MYFISTQYNHSNLSLLLQHNETDHNRSHARPPYYASTDDHQLRYGKASGGLPLLVSRAMQESHDRASLLAFGAY